MGTSYYRLKKPVTHVSVDRRGVNSKINVWIDNFFSGTLYVPQECTSKIVLMFAEKEGDTECPLRTYWGGAERGTVVVINDLSVPDDTVVISRYGEVLTVREVKTSDGAKRKDSIPTELFGYEDMV